MSASSRLRAWPLNIARDGLNCLKARSLGSIASISSTAESGDGDGTTVNSTTSAKPGSAEDLLNFLKIHRTEWKPRPPYLKKSRYLKGSTDTSSSFSSNYRRKQQRQPNASNSNFPSSSSSSVYHQNTQNGHHQRIYQQKHQPYQKPHHQQPKSATALGLSQSRRSREITNRIVAAFANADAQLRSLDLPKEDKLDAARRCILSFTRLSSLPLSDINMSAMMHRVCRLVTHRGLVETRTGGGSAASYPNLNHVPLMEGLLDDVIARAKLQLLLTEPEVSTGAKNAEAVQAARITLATDNDKLHDSTAALALYSFGSIGMHLSQSDIDILSSILLSYRPMWTEQRVAMVLLALGRLGVVYGELQQNSPTCDLLDALYTASEEKLENFSAEELSTLIWGFATMGCPQIKSEYLTKVMAMMLPKVDELPLVGVFSTLEGLMMHNWVPPAPKSAWIEVKNNNNQIGALESSGGLGGSGDGANRDDRVCNVYTEDFSKEGRFQVKDLRELQSVAKTWEQRRRSGLAEFLRGQQEDRGGTSSSSSFIQHQHEHHQQLTNDVRGGNIADLNLGALAHSAMRARAERANKAQLSDLAAKVARELRASVAATKGMETPPSSVNAELMPGEEDDALVARLLTGEWEERKNMDEKFKLSDNSTAAVVSIEEGHSLDRSLPLHNENSESQKRERQQLKLQETNASGRGRFRIFRLGGLLAEASINPSSGREIIQPHYERAHLWDPLLLHPSEHTSEQSLVEDGWVRPDLEDVVNFESQMKAEHTDLGGETLLHGDHPLSNTTEDVYNSASQDAGVLPGTTTAAATSDALREAAAAAVAALSQRIAAMVPNIRADQAVNFARYFSALRHYDRDLLIAVRDKVEEVLKDYTPPPPVEQDFSPGADGNDKYSTTATTTTTTLPIRSTGFADFLWSFASLGIVDLIPPQLSRKAIHAALDDREYSAVALSRAAWSLAVLGHLDGLTLKNVCARIVSGQSTRNSKDTGSRSSGSAITAETSPEDLKIEKHSGNLNNRVILKQLFQAALQVEISTGESHHTLLPAELRTTAADAWKDRRNFLSTSYLQRQVAGVLQNNLGLECELEHAPEGSFVVIDIAVFANNNTKFAVEVDGPYHYSTNRITHKLGAMQLRDSLLRHSGWEVVSVPYYEWMQAKPWEKAKYLEGKVMPILQRQRKR
ncbi:hypothetical protein NADE_008300 [Nannochloris sp. 'desiccata']|nr:hypothetical protein KSW81_000189 [Chlorella desiccata (nom. nud.)]KAH7620024.1 hypothetical protein NADE_008300 [Chlorella desiccata (nom. nud.)]